MGASLARIQSTVVIVILFVLQVTDGIDQAALAFTAPFVRKDLGIALESLGAAFSAGYLGTALGAVKVVVPPLAVWADEKFPQAPGLPQITVQSTPAPDASLLTVATKGALALFAIVLIGTPVVI